MIDINPTISVITLNINDLNAPTESQRLSKWIRNTTQLYAIYMKSTDSYRLKIKGQRKIFHANTNQKKVVIAKLIPDRADVRARKVMRDKKGHSITIRGSILQEDITNLNMYIFSNRVSKYVRQKLIELQGEIDESTITAGDFKTLYQKWTDTAGRKSIRTQFSSITPSINLIQWTSLDYSIQQQKHISSLQAHMEHSSKQITF